VLIEDVNDFCGFQTRSTNCKKIEITNKNNRNKQRKDKTLYKNILGPIL